MANPFGEKNIGPWEGQQVEYIPLDDLVLWTENPRDPLDGDYTNDDVIRRATDGRNDKQWQLSKLSKEMGDRFDLSELPTVCRIDDGPKYRVYDGNRRVILAMLRKAGLTTEGQQQLVPPDFPDPIPCNVCDEETALENVERKHRGNGSWKQYERDRFMFDYRGGPKTVLIRLEELIKAVTKWPALNMRYVEDDVFNKKHLEEMGLLPDEPDFGVPLELLEELVEAVADKLDNELNTRNARNDPASVLPGELMDRIREARHRRPAGEKADGRERELPSDNSEPPSQSHGGLVRDDVLRPDTSGTLPHTDASARRRRGRTRQVKPASIPVFGLEADLEPRTAAAGMARDSALSALSTLPDVVACVASPRTDAGKKISCGRHDAQERQRHKAADGEQRHQIVVPGGGQVQDDFEDVEHGLDQVSDVFHVPWYAFAGHVYARSRFW